MADNNMELSVNYNSYIKNLDLIRLQSEGLKDDINQIEAALNTLDKLCMNASKIGFVREALQDLAQLRDVQGCFVQLYNDMKASLNVYLKCEEAVSEAVSAIEI